MSALSDAILASTNSHPEAGDLFSTALPALTVMRATADMTPRHALYRPALCVNVQGDKSVQCGDEIRHYEEGQYLLVSVDLPVIGRITRASKDKPFLALVLEIDLPLLIEVMNTIGMMKPGSIPPAPGIFVGTFSPAMTDCALRLVQLAATPEAIPVLYPAIARELYYWLLTSPSGSALAALALPDSHTRRIARAIHAIRADLAKSVRIETLAALAGMSPSSFHAHFKAMTAMSPLQFQKQLRLLEARRLMVADATTASSAASHVGYGSASQFSRDYARMFGAPPRREASGARASLAGL